MSNLDAMAQAIMEQTGENRVVCEMAAKAAILAIHPNPEMLDILNDDRPPVYIWQDLVAAILRKGEVA